MEETLSLHEITVFLSLIGLLLILANFSSKLAERIKIPALVANVLIGIIAGPTFLGHLFPQVHHFFFSQTGNINTAYDILFKLSMIMLLFLAGLELDFSLIAKKTKAILITTFFSALIPFAVGVFFAWRFFNFFHGTTFTATPFVFPLLFGILMFLSSLPAIVGILMNANMLNTSLGTIIMGTVVLTDVLGWIGFSSVVVYANPAVENIEILYTILYIIGFFVFIYFITGIKTIIDKFFFKTKNNQTQDSSQNLSTLLGVCLLLSALTNYIGIHPSLGAFIAGILCKRMLGEGTVVVNQVRAFILSFFAPIFFISIGLQIDFVNNFNLQMVLGLLVLASVTKFLGSFIGAYLGGLNYRPAIATGVCLNARGTMEIIMGALALKLGLIFPQLFVAFVIISIVTLLFAPYSLFIVKNQQELN